MILRDVLLKHLRQRFLRQGGEASGADEFDDGIEATLSHFHWRRMPSVGLLL